MTQLGEAVARYHKLLESEPYKDLSWAQALQDQMRQRNLFVAGRPVSPVLRPHFISRRQYTNLVKAADSLLSAINRAERMALGSAPLLARMQLLPAEKMLAAVDPGYPFPAVTSLLDTHLNNGTLRFVDYHADTPAGVAYGELLADIFYEAAPVKEFRKKYKLSKMLSSRHLLAALLKAFREFGGKQKKPRIAILEFRQPFQTAESGEYTLLAEMFRREGFETRVVSPDDLEYRAGVLRAQGFEIDLVYRRVKVQEFLIRFDLSHPLVRAYRDHAVCVVNNFRSELAQKKAIFDLLTDETITGGFPATERKAIQDFIPWTRIIRAGKTTYHGKSIDLMEFIQKKRDRLVLRPNEQDGELHSFRGSETDDAGWEKAMRQATRNPYVVQETTEAVHEIFPVLQYGSLQMHEMRVDVQPHSFLGKVQGCSTWLSAVGPSGFSTTAGLAPTFILDVK
ncbi:MAG TPA: hypothetical protein VKV15_18630 [Bryobacteraceae bacterium]|nr:hypothetical protein [Bryobacteraceae bacterium]